LVSVWILRSVLIPLNAVKTDRRVHVLLIFFSRTLRDDSKVKIRILEEVGQDFRANLLGDIEEHVDAPPSGW